MPQYIVLPRTATLMSQADQDASVIWEPANILTRFAPSPNGPLHLGHAYAAICAHDFARAQGGCFLLRIEDIDGTRSRPEHIDGIVRDLRWLGLDWDGPNGDGEVIFQSTRIASYRAALERLNEMGLVYRCRCTRSEIAQAIKQSRVPHGPDGPVYPGTCRGREIDDGSQYCWRLDMAAAMQRAGLTKWTDLAGGEQIADPALFGDIVLWRKDAPASYHLAATLDDAADGVTHVVRGQDLFAYTAVHVLLQKLLGLLQPLYWHHRLLIGENGEKLSKSKASAALAQRRGAGEDGEKLAAMIRSGQLPLGISLTDA
jgi:glutamyl-Q tRNA(Asp) synthetase